MGLKNGRASMGNNVSPPSTGNSLLVLIIGVIANARWQVLPRIGTSRVPFLVLASLILEIDML